VTQAQAAVTQSEASVNQSQVNRDHTIIAAPIDGIVTQRNVDVGQTVAASMQAPTLFIIAADLAEMQVNANIDEADVGRIRPGQHVTFRVDAYPTDNFQGIVAQVRLQPVVVQNVTTYGTVITVPNTELKLKPGMTANVKIEIAKSTNVLRLPNAALRFRPTQEIFAALNQAVPPDMPFAGGGRGGRGGRAGEGALQSVAPSAAEGSSKLAAPGGSGAGQSPAVRGGGASRTSSAAREPGAAAAAPSPGEQTGQGSRGGRDGRGELSGADRQARMLERLESMSPDEREQFVARMKERGMDTSAFETAAPGKRPKAAAPQHAQTIDALFAPLPRVESRGRAWVFMDHQLKPANLRLGITDGTYTELLSDEMQENMEVVTGVTGLGPTRSTPTPSGTGNPLMPGRGPGGPGGRGGR
jgi:HlyD family secretion protein